MPGCHSRYFDRPSGVTPGFSNHSTSTSGPLSLKGRLKRKRHRANVAVSTFSNPAPQDERVVITTTCSICLSNILEPAELPCNHKFCFGCITEWAQSTATTCPLCKKEFQEIIRNHGRGVSEVIKHTKKVQRCQDEDFHPVGYSSSETMSSDEEEEVEEVPAVTRRGRPHGYIADGFVVVEDSEVEEEGGSLSDEIVSVMSEGSERSEDTSLTDEIHELLEDTKKLAERGLLPRSSRR